MVVRKPIPTESSVLRRQSNANSLPYPLSPTSSDRPNAGDFYTSNVPYSRNIVNSVFPRDHTFEPPAEIQRNPSYGSDMSDDWINEDLISVKSGSQQPTADNGKPIDAQSHTTQQLPLALRAGRPDETPRTSSESQRSRDAHQNAQFEPPSNSNHNTIKSTNPYLRAKTSDLNDQDALPATEESSVDVWAKLATGPPPTRSPPLPPPLELEANDSETDVQLRQIKNLSIYDRPAESMLATSEHTEGSPLISFEDNNHKEPIPQPLSISHGPSERRDYHYTDHIYPSDQKQQQHEQYQKVEIDSLRQEKLPEYRPNLPAKDLPIISASHTDDEVAPNLPARKPLKQPKERNVPPPQPPRPSPVHTTSNGFRGEPIERDVEKAQTHAKKQTSETYQIKHITWVDSSSQAPRISPIMVQNANGPCPLLALVNALTLSTPAHANTALIETLQIREQVSLGLLLDAVFDELMSGRRGDSAQELPDVGELYAFLITLHTGMNVNPQFVPPRSQPPNIIDGLEVMSSGTMHDYRKPGGFEETKEMKLYSTFSIPLIHGWLPPRNHPAFVALERSARTYEDAQNLMFHEEGLEEKLQHQGLNQEEQILLEDIASIKYFLSSSATQLTGYGLDTITEALLPGSIAILFRNDHFSTLYKHPRSGQLLTLVTDMGYAGHDEVVWESLVDVRGEGCEFFAGDFRPVGNSPDDTQRQENARNDDHNWTTVSRANRSNAPKKPSLTTTFSTQGTSTSINIQGRPTPPIDQSHDAPISPNNEQEDHDLALAMQLQEEEEDRSRRVAEARRREDELSQAYLHSQDSASRRGIASRSTTTRPLVPPREGSHATPRGASSSIATPRRETNPVPRAPLHSRADPEAGEEAPPPSYEQAAKSLPYHPPISQSPYSNPSPSGASGFSGNTIQNPRPRQLSAYSQHATSIGSGPSFQARRDNATRNSLRGGSINAADGEGLIRRRSAGVNSGSLEGQEDTRNKDCIIM